MDWFFQPRNNCYVLVKSRFNPQLLACYWIDCFWNMYFHSGQSILDYVLIVDAGGSIQALGTSSELRNWCHVRQLELDLRLVLITLGPIWQLLTNLLNDLLCILKLRGISQVRINSWFCHAWSNQVITYLWWSTNHAITICIEMDQIWVVYRVWQAWVSYPVFSGHFTME